MTKFDDNELTKFRDMIHARLKALSDEDALGADGTHVVELDQQAVGRLSRMDALQNQAMAQAGAGRRSQERQQLEAALTRIEDGTFGLCQDCEELIASKRLELDPTIRLCIECALG